MADVPRTLYEKVWQRHLAAEPPDLPATLYVDLHLVHEVTSPQAFAELERRGLAVRRLDMEGRMTLCNMSIEAGARAGMIAPDETTYHYLEGPGAPTRAWRCRSPAGCRSPATAPAAPRWRRP